MFLRKEWYKVSLRYCPFSLGPGMVSRDSLTVGALMKNLQSFSPGNLQKTRGNQLVKRNGEPCRKNGQKGLHIPSEI